MVPDMSAEAVGDKNTRKRKERGRNARSLIDTMPSSTSEEATYILLSPHCTVKSNGKERAESGRSGYRHHCCPRCAREM